METTWGQILKSNNISAEEFNSKCEGLENHEIAYRQLVLITKTLNGNWKADYTNSSQLKYENVFYDIGTGFSYTDYYCWHSDTSVGSRLCFKNSTIAKHAAVNFIDIYRRFLS